MSIGEGMGMRGRRREKVAKTVSFVVTRSLEMEQDVRHELNGKDL